MLAFLLAYFLFVVFNHRSPHLFNNNSISSISIKCTCYSQNCNKILFSKTTDVHPPVALSQYCPSSRTNPQRSPHLDWLPSSLRVFDEGRVALHVILWLQAFQTLSCTTADWNSVGLWGWSHHNRLTVNNGD